MNTILKLEQLVVFINTVLFLTYSSQMVSNTSFSWRIKWNSTEAGNGARISTGKHWSV